MDQQIVEQYLDEVLLFELCVSLFHGNRKVNAHDLSEALQVNVPTDDVFTLGVKRVFPKARVNALNRIKSAMMRECANRGPRFLGGYAIPESKADELATKLEELKKEGNDLKAQILAEFSQICSEYAKAHPKWADVITKNSFSEDYVRNRISFGYHCVKVKAARDSGIMAASIGEEVGGLLGNLFADIAKSAQKFIEDSLTDREAVTRKALRPLVAAREKLSGFTFLDMRVQPLCTIIDKLVESMPGDGPIEGVHLANLVGMASILVNTKLALELGAKANDSDPDSVFAAFCQQQAALVAPKEAPAEQPSVEVRVLQPIEAAATQVQAPAQAHAQVVQPLQPPGIPETVEAPASLDFGNLFAA